MQKSSQWAACYNRIVYTTFRKILTQNCGIKWNDPLVVGVSGGADSLTLLHLLTRAKVPTLAIYFNHQLRKEAAGEAEFVAKLARQWGAAFLTGSADVHQVARENRLSLEAAARRARYTFLFEMARLHNAQGVATGHTADDQVETILLHILRGSGMDGLRGMTYLTRLDEFSADLPLFRPLLAFWRSDVEQYIREHGIQPLEDRTNLDKRFLRNRVRHELLPVLQTYNPQIKARIFSLGQVVEDGMRILQPVVEEAFNRTIIQQEEDWLAFSTELLRSFSPELIAFILHHGVHVLQPHSEDINRAAIERCVEQIQSSRSDGMLVLGDGIELIFAQKRLYLRSRHAEINAAEFPAMDSDRKYFLDAPGEIQLSDGWVLQVERITNPGTPLSFGGDPFQAWLDGERIKFPLEIRSWQAGDRFTPFGMVSGSLKVADFFSRKHIPRPARKKIPLILSGGDIAWVAGLQISEKYRVTERTTNLLCLRITRVDHPG